MDTFVAAHDMIEKRPVEGAVGHIVHGEGLTAAYWEFEAGTMLPEHSHVHEQIVFVVDGRLELTVGDRTQALDAGEAAVIPPNIVHGATALTRCRIVDSFTPKREDLV